MKKTISFLLCLVLACGLLAGCGGNSPKIPPENFPHSETLRMDATVEEAVNVEGLEKDETIENNYKPIFVKIDNLEWKAFFHAVPTVDKISISYFLQDEKADLAKTYKQFVEYFTEIYGEASGKIPMESTDVIKIIENIMWTYILDDKEYFVEVQHQTVVDTTQLVIIAGPIEIFDL